MRRSISAREQGQPTIGSGTELTVAAAIPALIANLALEIAPVRVNLIAAGLIDTPYRHRCLAATSKSGVISCARSSRSDASWDRLTSPRSPSTS